MRNRCGLCDFNEIINRGIRKKIFFAQFLIRYTVICLMEVLEYFVIIQSIKEQNFCTLSSH